MASFLSRTITLVLLSGIKTLAAPDQATTQACADIQNALPGKVLTPSLLALEYEHETQQYWSTTLRTVDPACIVQPSSAEDVATVVKILNNYPTVKFATRSGGHDPNVGHATAQDGVQIVMTDLAGATYDAEKDLAYVKPGGEWNDVISDLESSGVAVVGGRLGLVGVGGYLLQGGISFLSAQEGLAADNIVGWETVLANGSIVNIDAAAHPDLAQAIRGSGSQFGIVTKFTIKPHHIGDVYGGFCVYDNSVEDSLYTALHDFTAKGAEDPKAAIIFSQLVAVGGLKTNLIYTFYDGPTPPTTGPFADLLNIPGIACLPRRRSYASLLRTNGEPTYTLPYIASRPQMYKEIRDKLVEISEPFLTVLRATSQFSLDFQPLPSLIGKISESKGGNAMGLSASDPDRLIIEIQGSWTLASDDAQGYSVSKQLTDWLDEQVPEWLAEAGMSTQYLPLFMNDAAGDQDVTGSYKDVNKFRALQRSMDPNGLFSTRAGGYKY
ncbi:hypothetical protein OPT61_g8178 [Boeremia exigua]|uniref:Uncharacterized protein n=1 Tax=Boeremia exigua TaxID=749465 RepID=A0ACC2HZQ7_9PLEO|nr:hypothetical protein OPT61_g8178 [Boeremia exigua]